MPDKPTPISEAIAPPVESETKKDELIIRKGIATQPFSCPDHLPDEITTEATKAKPLEKPENMPLEDWNRLFDGTPAFLRDAAK
jgi:hypothetical protein